LRAKVQTHRRSQNLRPSCPAVTIILELSGSLEYDNKIHTSFNMRVKRCATDSYRDEFRCMMFACVIN